MSHYFHLFLQDGSTLSFLTLLFQYAVKGLLTLEAESMFYDTELKLFEDVKHSSKKEQRWIGYGKSRLHRIVMVAFTLRRQKVRIISVRPASKKERSVYYENE